MTYYAINFPELAAAMRGVLSAITDVDPASPAFDEASLDALARGSLRYEYVDLDDPNSVDAAQWAQQLLADRAEALLTYAGIKWKEAGFSISRTDRVESLGPVLDINSAPLSRLEPLPHIGDAAADNIRAERIKSPFSSLQDAADRVSGFGDTGAAKLAGALAPDSTLSLRPRRDLDGPVEDSVLRLFSTLDGSVSERAEELVALLIQSTHLFPPGEERRWIDWAEHPFAWHDVDIEDLYSERYYFRLLEMLREAQERIYVEMFHAAMPSESHPTKDLLDVLIEKAANGVEVKVLLDADRESDPYLSTVINTDAFEYLAGNGVDVRWDREEELLHTKLVVIDRELTVIGSHNWSAGSYFHHEDLSVAIRSLTVNTESGDRFIQSWNVAPN